MLTRYTQNSWKMQAGDIPMPPPSRVPGRWQQLASGEVTEVQVPYLDMEQARELADRRDRHRRARPGCPAAPAYCPSHASPCPRAPLTSGLSEDSRGQWHAGLTVKEAVAEGIFGPRSIDTARKRVQRARLEPVGQRGDGSHTYDRAALFAAARDRRKERSMTTPQ